MIAYKQIAKLSPTQLNQLHELYKKEWWSANRSLEDTEKIVANSSMIFGFVDQNNSLVAFCRILTDHCVFAYIYDLIVKHEYRNLGFGGKIIEAVKNHPEIKLLDSIELVCRKEMIEFYQQHGFTTDYGKSISMRFKSVSANF